jgi:hypothetical protein
MGMNPFKECYLCAWIIVTHVLVQCYLCGCTMYTMCLDNLLPMWSIRTNVSALRAFGQNLTPILIIEIRLNSTP